MATHEEPRAAEGATLEHQPTTDTFDMDDPHQAAIRDNPTHAERLTWSTILSVLFLAISFVGPISFGFILPTSIIVQIGTELGDTSNIAWIASGWSVASSVSFSIAGDLSDIFGRRYIVLCGQFINLIGAIVASTAKTTNSVIVGGTLMGFGCGMVFVAYAGIPELLPNKWRGAGLATTEFMMVVPWNLLSTYLAYKFIETATWRWCYYSAIIYSVVAFSGTAIVYFPPSRPRKDYEKTRWQEIRELDYVGIFLYTTGLTVFLIGLSWAGTTGHAWKSASVIAPIVVGALVFIGCFIWSFYFSKNPFFPLRLFARIREFTILLLLVFVAGMIFYSMSALLPQGSLYMFTNDPTQLGLISLPNGFGQLIGGCILPSLVHKIKHTRAQIVVALFIQTLFCALYAYAVPTHKAAWMAFQLFGQGAFGLITLNCYIIAGLHVRQTDLGLASGLIGTFRSGGGSVGNAIFSTILNGVANSQLGPRISAAAASTGFDMSNIALLIPAVAANAVGTPDAFASVPGITPAVEAATSTAFKDAYGYAFRRVFFATLPFNVIALASAFFIKDISQYLTNHTAIHLERDVLGGHEGLVEKKVDDDGPESVPAAAPVPEPREVHEVEPKA